MMKQIKYLLIVGILILSQLSLVAQRRDGGKERWEKYRTEKISFLTDNLELTPEEAQKFWPVYNQMDKERWEAQKMRRELEHKLRDAEENLSDKEAIKLTKEFAGSMQKEANAMVNYNDKFLEILPPKKVLKLYKAENEFRMHMIRKYRDRKKNGENHP